MKLASKNDIGTRILSSSGSATFWHDLEINPEEEKSQRLQGEFHKLSLTRLHTAAKGQAEGSSRNES